MPQKNKDTNPQHTIPKIFFTNFIGGIGWVLGMTVGVSLLALLISSIISTLGGLPIIGNWIAQIVQVTQQALNKNNPSLPTPNL